MLFIKLFIDGRKWCHFLIYIFCYDATKLEKVKFCVPTWIAGPVILMTGLCALMYHVAIHSTILWSDSGPYSPLKVDYIIKKKV